MTRTSGSAVATLLLLALIALHWLGPLKPVEGLLVRALRPVQKLAATIHRPARPIPADVEERLVRLEVENAVLGETIRQYEARVATSGFLTARSLRSVSATIIGAVPDSDGQSYILDRGTEEGIGSGLAVIAGDGVLIGLVSSAENGRSILRTVTNSDSKVAVTVENDARSAGIAAGDHGLTISVQYLPQTDTIAKGDRVTTSSLTESVPAGLVVGTVTDTTSSSGDLYQSVTAAPLLDPARLRYVAVLLPS